MTVARFKFWRDGTKAVSPIRMAMSQHPHDRVMFVGRVASCSPTAHSADRPADRLPMRLLATAAAVAALLLAGCGGGDETPRAVEGTTTSPPVSTVPMTSVTSPPPTIPPTAAPPTTAPPITIPPTTIPPLPTTTATTTPPTIMASPASGACHPSYTGVCLPVDASDVDCPGGSGNGPVYAPSGNFQVVGPDTFDLDRDADGIGCE